MKQKLMIGLLAILTYAFMCFTVNAYVLSGDAWGGGSLDPLYYIESTQYDTALDTSVDDWNDESMDSGDFDETGNPSTADVEIEDVDLVVGWAGQTANSVYITTIMSSTVQLNEYYLDGYSTDERRCTIAHELGHVWGLDHEDDDEIRALMYSWHTQRWYWGIYVPQDDDVDGVNAIY